MAEEFSKVLEEARKGTPEEKIEVLGTIIENLLHVVFKMPKIFDQMLDGINEKIADLEKRFDEINRLQTSTDTIQSTESTQIEPRPPPPPPLKEEEIDSSTRGASTHQRLMTELKDWFDKMKEKEKNDT